MQSQRGIVQSIEDKKYMRGATIFQVHILQESLDLARFLASLQVSGKKIEVVEQQGRIVAIELR
ncbi:MAG: hypothetical protein KDK51_08410, partial [Deltaproteobacteria bacterium]|nr:hypothetical protein [Deltaproteobacteria bacterium]